MKYSGNISQVVDCDNLINTIKQHDVLPMHGHMDLDKDNPCYTEYKRQTDMLKHAGYTEDSVEYRHYSSGKHFSKDIEIAISKYVNCNPLMCWISEIRPGKCTPWHNDINPWEIQHKKLGTLVRYISFISKPQFGHIFVTDSNSYYNELQGNIYQYPDIYTFHAGANVGLVPKYVLTLTGYI
jgi:hypothetical protein